jgi:hypothetical protein
VPPTWVPLFSSIRVESDGRDWMISLPVNLARVLPSGLNASE